MDQHVGVLVVHGIGEQKRFETARQIARSIMAGLQARDGGAHFSLVDRSSDPDGMPLLCPRADRQGSPFMIACRAKGSTEQTYVHLHEVWWSDLGAPATFGEQIKFWLWGLGQWYARVVWASSKGSNTELFMEAPTKFRSVESDTRSTKPRPFARSMLFLTGFYALLTLFSWEAIKRAFAWLSPYAGSPAILTSYVGDVRIYTQGPGKGGGNITDIGQPWRATIRRRMIAQLVAMAERQYDRWYVMGHSLGSIVAFNGVQETEWNLPNYLDPAQIERIRSGVLKDELWLSTPPASDQPKPNLNKMMPRRPIWLDDNDRISRAALFKNFRGLITYGSPLDKFAALWPRIVPVNKQRDVFRDDADWINLSDATDPVGANIEAFESGWSADTPTDQSPHNIRVKVSPFYLLAHICYFGAPSRGGSDRPETRALVDLLFPADGTVQRLGTAFAGVGNCYGSKLLRIALAVLWIIGLGAALIAATSWLALIVKSLGDGAFALATTWLTAHWPNWLWLSAIGLTPGAPECAWRGFVGLFQLLPVPGFLGTMATTAIVAFVVVFAAGVWRRSTEAERKR